MAVIRLAGGTRISTQSGKRYQVVMLANPKQGRYRPKIVLSTDKLDVARKEAPRRGGDVIIDMTSGDPVR